ncbi:MAG: Rne/Rng family ribonuclease, partial [Acidimicrobiales bacterium]
GRGGRSRQSRQLTPVATTTTPAAPRTRQRSSRATPEVTEAPQPVPATRRRGRERNGRPVGRYLMCVHVAQDATQIAVLEGRSLIELHVARASDDANQIDGNIYRGRVKNVLPGMEAAFVDIGTPKNAVLYWGDVQTDRGDEIEREPGTNRIEHLLRPGQTIICQVTKNPIGLKGARLTQEVSLPGRFVVLVPDSPASGISKRLDDKERRRLRKILEEVRPEGHGIILRTAAEGATAEDLRRDVSQLVKKWDEIADLAKHVAAPALLYAEPHLALRAIREEFTEDYRGVMIDDPELFELVRDYVNDIDPTLADRVEYYDQEAENLPLFERHHVHEQLHKALDRKVWLPSGGSIIIDRTEALTVIDVNTGKNVGSSSLEETVFRNNVEAAEEIARQLRLRDIGGIIVIDFIDMELKANRQEVAATLRDALARDKTPTQVFEISELGLVEMTRKRVGEGLVEALSETCPMCKGRGIIFPEEED